MSTHKTLSALDPQQFRLVQSSAPSAKAAHSNGRKFIARIDVVWAHQARQLGVTALFVGLALWYLKGLRRSNTFIVSNMMLEDWGVTKWAKLRSLRSLEKAGLVAIEWRGKRSPLVTLVMPADTPPRSQRRGAAIRHPSGSITTYRRFNKPPLGPLGDRLDDFQ